MGDIATGAEPQHLRALERANRVRLARAALKRSVGAGELDVADVITNPHWQVEGMSVSELLMSQRGWGRARCRRVLLSLGVAENKRIGTLTERQRAALADALTEPDTERRALPRHLEHRELAPA